MVLLTIVNEFSGRGRRHIQTELNSEALPKINDFLKEFAASRGWDGGMTGRMQAPAEETLLILGHQDNWDRGDADSSVESGNHQADATGRQSREFSVLRGAESQPVVGAVEMATQHITESRAAKGELAPGPDMLEPAPTRPLISVKPREGILFAGLARRQVNVNDRVAVGLT